MIETGDWGSTPATCTMDVASPEATLGALRAFHRRAIRRSRAAIIDAPRGGYRFFIARDELVTTIAERRIDALGFAIAGRHPRCQLHLADDEGVSLRHLFFLADRGEDGAPVLRVLDLRAGLPFRLLDETPRRAVAAIGAVGLRVGRYAIVAVPEGREPPEDLPDPIIVDGAHEDEGVPTPSPDLRYATVVSIAPRPIELSLAREVRDPVGILSATRHGREANVVVERSELERGLLVGRLPRCVEGGWPDVLGADVSRLHLLLLRHGDKTQAFDLASLNGTWVGGRRVDRVEMSDGARVGLGTAQAQLRWRNWTPG